MNLNKIQPKNEAEDLLLSITKNCETPIEQVHRETEETLDFKTTKPRETFQFNPPIQNKGDCMIGLITFEVYQSIFIITEENNNFKLHTDNYDEISFEELKSELEEIFSISDITPYHLQHKK